VVVLVLKTISIKRIFFHFVVIECANGIQIGHPLQLLELFLGFIEIENTFDTVKVLSDIVLVLEYAKSSLNLILVHVARFNDDLFNLIIIDR
jgi:hypothetical protein